MRIANWVNGREEWPSRLGAISKENPHTGTVLSEFPASDAEEVSRAIAVAQHAQCSWSELPPVRRGQILMDMARAMRQKEAELAACVAQETGKPPGDALGEVRGATQQAEYFAGEGMRLHGRSLTSAMPGKSSHTVRQPLGVAGLIVPANTPIANIAWKVFPALICGNTAVLKAAEDSPAVALRFAQLAQEVGLPDGVLNVVQGRGDPAGASLVADARVAVVSFTGSTSVGRHIAEVCGRRLARVSLELGGKNPFVVCDDADLDQAVHWASLSAFSNAGQRCAAGSRILVFANIYEVFRDRLVNKARSLTMGVTAGSDLGPVVNRRQWQNILHAVERAVTDGGQILCGGKVPSDPGLAGGFYIEPTLIDGLPPEADLNCREIFGPVAVLQRVDDLRHALAIANQSDYGLTAAIHTRSVDRAMWFAHRVRAGVANVNIGTFGSEPHMPFGGFGASGNGTREPGVEALDVYSELKNISFLTRDTLL